jgi:hypothetical protein
VLSLAENAKRGKVGKREGDNELLYINALLYHFRHRIRFAFSSLNYEYALGSKDRNMHESLG